MDFQTSTQISQKTEQMTGGVGTPLYMAPEIKNVSERASYTQKVDIYALGIILYEII